MARNRHLSELNRINGMRKAAGLDEIEKIEAHYEKHLADKRLLSEAFLLGKNKFGNPDITPRKAIG